MYNNSGNEDLLPRTAPIPSASAVPDTNAKPTVPEVSIIFGEQNHRTPLLPKTSSTNNSIQKPIQSYSAWKKQCLPHVMYADDGLQGGSSTENSPRNNIYPMKQISSQSRLSLSPQPPIYTSPSQQARIATPPLQQVQNAIQQGSHFQPARINTQQQYPVIPTQPFSIDNNLINSLKQALGLRDPIPAPVQQTREQLLQSMQPTNPNVLTICAGTQTESEHQITPSNNESFATKDDVREIMRTLNEMRTDQIKLIQLLQIALESKSVTREVGIQCEITGNQHHLALEDYRVVTPKVNFQKQQRTPQQNIRTPYKQQVLTKPTTEQSLVMNELAMKYLPSHKLSDLLQEIHTNENHSPLRVIDNVMRTPVAESPNDISNASYKYLKKYRLLPEEEENQDLDLDAIRNQPKFL